MGESLSPVPSSGVGGVGRGGRKGVMTEAQTRPLMCAWIGGWVTTPVIGAAGEDGEPLGASSA